MIFDYVTITLIGLCWFSFGYFVGHLNGTKTDVREFVDETGQRIAIETKKLVTPKPSLPTGRIRPISAQEAYKRSINPERREALEETKKSLDAIPELVQAKALAAQMRKEQYG